MNPERDLRAMREFASRALHPDDLFALKYVHDARFSPDGCHVAYVTSRTVKETAQEFFELTIEELATKTRREVKFKGRSTFPRWSPEGTRLAFIGIEGNLSRLYLTDASARQFLPLTPENCQVQGPFSWSPDGTSIAYAVVTQVRSHGIRRITKRNFRSEGQGIVNDFRLSIHVVDIKRGTARSLKLDKTIAMQPAFSPCGKRILFVGSDAPVAYSVSFLRDAKLFLVDINDGHMAEVVGGDRWSISGAAWSPCGEKVVFAGAYDSQLPVPTMSLWVVNQDGSNPQCRTTGFVGNVGLRVHHDMPTWNIQNNIFVVPNATEAYVTVGTHGCGEIWRIALAGPPHCEPVAVGARSCLVMDVNLKTSQLLFCVSDLKKPWDLCQSNLQGAEERRLTDFNDAALALWPAVKVEHLKFEGSDGLSLEGWYLSRADRQGAQPTVMFLHGGPYHATGHAFRFDFHLLAANGYGVLFANFRGSTGYGEPFARAIMGDWGARGFPDHMAAVDAAIAHDLADEKRLGIWGQSHGGFATAWIVGHTNRFRAAVVESGATNFSTMYYLSDAPHLLESDLGGRPDEIPDVYRSRSPLTYALRCRTPTLMLHGEDDLRCPMAEAEQFYRVLHDAGCVTELVQIPGMNHMGDATGPLSARQGQNEALLEWFERYL